MCLAALLLVIVSAIRLGCGGADELLPGYVSMGEQKAYDQLLVAGQVYQKDESFIYLRSVFLSESSVFSSGLEVSGQLTMDLHQALPCQENILCETENAGEIPLGSTVVLRGVFYPCSPATNPGEFDSAVYYRTLEVGGRLRKGEILYQSEECWRLREGLFRLKSYFKERLYSIFPEKEAAVMSALLLGDKSELDGELKDLYKRNGILHILSISSLHITIIGMSLYKLLRRVGIPIAPAAVAGSLLLILYGCMTGFGVSACRAIGMYLIRMMGEIAGRTYDMLTALGVMAAVMAIDNPYYLRSSGFLLSFGSVLGIGVLSPALLPGAAVGGGSSGGNTSGRSTKNTFRQFLKRFLECFRSKGVSLYRSVLVSLSITLATLPIQLAFYYEVPVYSVFLNLFVIPLMKPMMITGLLALLVPGLGILGSVDRLILGTYEFLCGRFDGLPFHTWNPGCPKVWQIMIYYLLLAGVVIWKNKTKRSRSKEYGTESRKAAFIGPCTICLAVLVLALHSPAENSVTFLDVGQGDCIVVRTSSGQTYLFDCGSSSRSSVGKYVLLPYLKYSGIQHIDAIFLSHPDADHINGALELLDISRENHITVGQLLLPAIQEEEREEQFGEILEAAVSAGGDGGISVGYLSAGNRWNCGDTVFTCLHPAWGFGSEDVNAYSECFYVEFNKDVSGTARRKNGQSWTLLLTGDVQGKGESAFVEEIITRDIQGITVLKAAHHGSRNSTPDKLLEQLSPAVTVISSGRNNRYGHPHKELLERLEESGTYILQTAQSGAITIIVRNGEIRVSAMLESQ